MQFISGLFFLNEPPPPARRGHAHAGRACGRRQQVGKAPGIKETLGSGKAVSFFHTEAWKRDWNIAA